MMLVKAQNTNLDINITNLYSGTELDKLPHVVTAIVLDYCASITCTRAVNPVVADLWYGNMKREIEKRMKNFSAEINCFSDFYDAQSYCIDMSEKMIDLLTKAGVITGRDENDSNDFNPLPMIDEVQSIVDQDLITVFKEISKIASNDQLNTILTNDVHQKGKAETLRKWLITQSQNIHFETTTTLDLSIFKLKTIPSEIGKLKQLQGVYLYKNQLLYIPTSIDHLILCRQNDNINFLTYYTEAPLNVFNDFATTIILDYCVSSTTAQAANAFANKIWYSNLKKEASRRWVI